MTTEEWQFVLGPNLWGVIHGVRVFTKHLVAQNEGHIVNTASLAGLISVPGMAAYNVSKHAVVTLSETLHGELANAAKGVGVSVLCPGFVNTQIVDSERFKKQPVEDTAERQQRQAMIKQFMASAMSPDAVAEMVHDAVRNRRFYILTHKGSDKLAMARVQSIVDGGSPSAVDASTFMGSRG